jgi:transposase-like protein
VAVISMLAEGTNIRATERITGVNQNTIMSLNRRVGEP